MQPQSLFADGSSPFLFEPDNQSSTERGFEAPSGGTGTVHPYPSRPDYSLGTPMQALRWPSAVPTVLDLGSEMSGAAGSVWNPNESSSRPTGGSPTLAISGQCLLPAFNTAAVPGLAIRGLFSAPAPHESLSQWDIGTASQESQGGPYERTDTLVEATSLAAENLLSTIRSHEDRIANLDARLAQVSGQLAGTAPEDRLLWEEQEAFGRVYMAQRDVVPWVADAAVVSRAVSGQARSQDLFHLANPGTAYNALVPPSDVPTDSEMAAGQFVDFFRSRPESFDSAWCNYIACIVCGARPNAFILVRAMTAHREILRTLSWAYPRASVLLYHYQVQERRRLETEPGLAAIGEVDQAALEDLQPRIVFDQPSRQSSA